jgi:hypothetical protein
MLAYCDFIADRIRKALQVSAADTNEPVHIDNVGRVQYDLHPTEGYFMSTKKTIEVEAHGKKYRVIVEEV